MIYLDNGATTEIDPKALDLMVYYSKTAYANPMSQYGPGEEARRAIEKARRQIAEAIGASPREIFFTSGGSESDNWVLNAAAGQATGAGAGQATAGSDQAADAGQETGTGGAARPVIITSRVEHPAILKTAEYLEKTSAAEIEYLEADGEGFVDPADLEKILQARSGRVKLVSVMTANNEIGTLEPIPALARAAHGAGALLHTDAVQAIGHIPVNMKTSGADLLSASAHKFGGPKGVGFLYIREGLEPEPFIHGGSQERGRRAGTHNVPAICAMGQALEDAVEKLEKHQTYETMLRDYFTQRVLAEIPGARLNGPKNGRKKLPGNISLTFPGADNEGLLMLLDQAGICASAGSACSAGALEPSHVLQAIGMSEEEIRQTIRITLTYRNTREEMDRTLDVLKDSVRRLREE